jgi:hypothetical protein
MNPIVMEFIKFNFIAHMLPLIGHHLMLMS